VSIDLDVVNHHERGLQVVARLITDLGAYYVPLLIASDVNLRPGQVKGGTGTLFQLGERRLMITCAHVMEEYVRRKKENPAEVLVPIFSEGYRQFAPLTPKVEMINREIDVAILNVSGVDTGILSRNP
jgi:hypothetical protein